MLDFLMFNEEVKLNKRTESMQVIISPEFKIGSCKDLMIRGSDFYAVWNEETGFWVTDEIEALNMIDNETKLYSDQYKAEHPDYSVKAMYAYRASSGVVDRWHKYVQKQMRDKYKPLDEKIIFAGSKPKKTDYASRQLPYEIKKAETPAYDELMNTLYSPEERTKIEWAVGSVITGDSKSIQKFLVLYGSAGTGKSTVLNIIQKLFDGYYGVFDAKSLGMAMNAFALDSFRDNPLVMIQHDGDLSRIEDNTKLNSVISHETLQVNEKFKKPYKMAINAFLFMGTNKPVRITDAKSGMVRRLIDVNPTGDRIPRKRYDQLVSQIDFELGGIAYHCKEVYLEDPGRYEDYIPRSMISATNDMFNFVLENYFDFKDMEYVTLNEAYARYKLYCEDSKISYPYPKRAFKEELKNYFDEFDERSRVDKDQVWNVYRGFKTNKFNESVLETDPEPDPEDSYIPAWLKLEEIGSYFDGEYADCYAQYAKEDGTPLKSWDSVTTKLKDIDTKKLHYVRIPENHIVIDFDLKDADGNKDVSSNLKAASKWPETYAEFSKSGGGLHLHYIYDGDVTKLSRVYDEGIEVKVYTGKSALRRKLTKCNGLQVAIINSGLPMKGDTKVINWDGVKSEKQLRTMIIKNLKKEYHNATKPSIDYIATLLDDAYNSGLHYDVSDLKSDTLIFAMNSTHNSDYCIKKFMQMKFKSEEPADPIASDILPNRSSIVFYDVEVFPNLFLVNWKYENVPECTRMINPTPVEIERLLGFNLIGFNNRRYDNHILYARMMGYTNEQLFQLSKDIVENKTGFFGEAYNLSYTDVYDFCSKKQSLKKWEIELGIHHQELGIPWDKPVPEDRWEEVALYCDNDVIATEAVFHERKSDFDARVMLAAIANIFCKKNVSTPNDTTNTLTGRIIFGDNRNPQSEFVYTDLSTLFPGYSYDPIKRESTYRGFVVGEGGFVYSKPGIHLNVDDEDISSMHPHSAIALNIFGDRYTKQFKQLVDLRVLIKHKDFDSAKQLFNGALSLYLNDESEAKNLANALKIAINSVYGLTSASFHNLFKDPRNIDNIVAKRGALFMIDLLKAVEERGYTVAHIKTDSIKIANADDYIVGFVREYGKKWGYTFETEAIFDKFCLVNDAVYIAKVRDGDWTATGTQFQVPYVFKTLFSKEPIIFSDYCETKSVTSGAIYLDMNEGLPDGEHNYIFVGRVGQFTPVKEGTGGGLLVRDKGDGKYTFVTGSKGYRWKESEQLRALGKTDDVDTSYYRRLVDEAVDTISKYGDFEEFADSDLPF